MKPITETVHFLVTVSTIESDDHWVTRTLETTIFGYGSTKDEAEKSAGDANVLIVKELKLQGKTALAAFMHRHGVSYSIGDSMPMRTRAENLARAA